MTHNTLDSQPETAQSEISIRSLKLNQPTHFYSNHQREWVKSLLEEICDGIEESEHGTVIDKNSNLEINFSLKKKYLNNNKEYVLLTGSLSTRFWTFCVRCLQLMKEEFTVPLNACFIPDQLKKSPEYHEQISIFIDDQEFDLYFYANNSLEIKEFLREQLFLNINPHPLHSADCKGMCQICGENLNNHQCSHSEMSDSAVKSPSRKRHLILQ